MDSSSQTPSVRQTTSTVATSVVKDAIAPPPPPPSQAFGQVDVDDGPVLTVPYPTEACCSRLLRQFPNRLGLFVAGRPKNYAFRANRMSIEQTVSHLGYRVQQCSSTEEPPSAPPSEPDTNEATELEREAAETAAAERLASDLQSMGDSLSFLFLKPCKLPWEILGNCLVFEPSHGRSLFASDKWHMAQILRRRSRVLSMRLRDGKGDTFDYRSFTMYTANPGRGQKLMLKYLDANPGVFVLKRTNSSQGIGIHMYHAKQPNTLAKLQRCVGPKAKLGHFVLQKYIERPLLIDKRKFDLRAYLLVLSCACPQRPGERGYFAFCHPGYVKLSSRAYAQGSRDPRVHFTNQWVQRRVPAQYERVKEATTWLPDELDAYLDRRGNVEAGWCRRRMYRQMQAVTGYLAAACRPYLESRRPGCVFRIYGPDLIVDEELRLQLLEFNCFPCYAQNTVALAASVAGMWREAVAVATEASVRYRERRPMGGSQRLLAGASNFRLVYNSERPELLQGLVRSCYP